MPAARGDGGAQTNFGAAPNNFNGYNQGFNPRFDPGFNPGYSGHGGGRFGGGRGRRVYRGGYGGGRGRRGRGYGDRGYYNYDYNYVNGSYDGGLNGGRLAVAGMPTRVLLQPGLAIPIKQVRSKDSTRKSPLKAWQQQKLHRQLQLIWLLDHQVLVWGLCRRVIRCK